MTDPQLSRKEFIAKTLQVIAAAAFGGVTAGCENAKQHAEGITWDLISHAVGPDTKAEFADTVKTCMKAAPSSITGFVSAQELEARSHSAAYQALSDDNQKTNMGLYFPLAKETGITTLTPLDATVLLRTSYPNGSIADSTALLLEAGAVASVQTFALLKARGDKEKTLVLDASEPAKSFFAREITDLESTHATLKDAFPQIAKQAERNITADQNRKL